MNIIHHGGKHTVTGSCHELNLNGVGVLIDCGLVQGKSSKSLNIEFTVRHIKALVLTHSHIDHIGRIPWLLAAGFHQPIYCTPATAELLPLMLEDGLKLQLGLGQAQRTRILERLNKQIKPVNYGVWQRISRDLDNTYFRFTPAGHILGSAFIEVKLPNNEIVLFSGDLGPCNTPLLPDPVSPPRADYLLIESTYANKTHDNVQLRAQRLKDIINRSLQDGGTILIPAFSVGRTQELLFDIEQLIFSGEIDGNIPIILDSPMAQQVTKSYRKFKKLWGKEAKKRLDAQRHPLAFEQCITVQDYRSHQALVNRLASTGEAAIVVAASGMCEGGRVMAYLKALLPDKRTDVIFAGFQAQGTLGRSIAQGDHSVMIDGDDVLVNAQVHSMSGYSAHADQADLLRFIEGIATKPKQIHLIHGEPTTKQVFAVTLRSLGYEVID